MLQETPAIYVVLHQISEDALQQLFWGMEEEGIPFRISTSAENDLRSEAHQAASLSPLAVGIACNPGEIVLHTRNLSPDTPLFHLILKDQEQDRQLRHLGCNAARLVKGLPFKPL
ncbi:glycerol dehydratase reactivase beta/small subunit family protein [Vibrio mangrovi]|nr:glycerol dehydratase reactivase beta/small subunit family protein [Vibrio mangrovi]MDW6005180.1 glycerol dehydratase reactivase beta/small subunit family protein [Vibrio mangrovi]